MKLKRPFLACSRNVLPEDLQSLQYPIYGTPKLDGIRMLIVKEGKKSVAVSRSMKLIPSAIVQSWVMRNNLPEGLDGEIIIPGKTFHEIQSKVMTEHSLPFNFLYLVFDRFDIDASYLRRVAGIERVPFVKYYRLVPVKLKSPEEVLAFESKTVDEGYEGIILRDGYAFYKQGRSTWKEGFMLKMKRFTDCEGIITGFEEKLTNTNSPFRDERGYKKRSSHKANQIPADTLGKLLVQDTVTRQMVTLGGGWDAALAKEIWNNKEKYLGLTATYKKQTHGEKDAPRIATFKGIRYD